MYFVPYIQFLFSTVGIFLTNLVTQKLQEGIFAPEGRGKLYESCTNPNMTWHFFLKGKCYPPFDMELGIGDFNLPTYLTTVFLRGKELPTCHKYLVLALTYLQSKRVTNLNQNFRFNKDIVNI